MAASGSSMFTVSVGNLRHYLRDRQGQQHRPPPPPPQQQQRGLAADGPDLQLALPVPTEGPVETDDKTVELFPTRSMPQEQSQILVEARGKGVLTIMYQGEVHIFQDFPGEKTINLLQMAVSELTSTLQGTGSPAGPVLVKRTGDLPLDDVFNTKVRRKVTLLHPLHWSPNGDSSSQGIAKEKEGADFKAMKDLPSPSWLGL